MNHQSSTPDQIAVALGQLEIPDSSSGAGTNGLDASRPGCGQDLIPSEQVAGPGPTAPAPGKGVAFGRDDRFAGPKLGARCARQSTGAPRE